MVSITEFVDALKTKMGLAAAKEREKENLSRMEWLLRQNRQTFLRGLEEYGLKPGETSYEIAVTIYDDLR
jgi:hypothetical protein